MGQRPAPDWLDAVAYVLLVIILACFVLNQLAIMAGHPA